MRGSDHLWKESGDTLALSWTQSLECGVGMVLCLDHASSSCLADMVTRDFQGGRWKGIHATVTRPRLLTRRVAKGLDLMAVIRGHRREPSLAQKQPFYAVIAVEPIPCDDGSLVKVAPISFHLVLLH